MIKAKEGGVSVERLEEIKILKESNKSRISLVYDSENTLYYVEKILTCPLEAYQKLASITSPYLPKIFLVEEREGKTYVLEEYIKGNSIEGIKPTKHQENTWVLELLQGLESLHKVKLLHRDIKPSNILLGEDGHIRLIDFDAVREESEEKESDTRLLGTQGYAPPEQYGFSSTDVRADIYALGVTMKEILENRPSHRRIIQKCTNFSPEKRYSSVKKLRKAWKHRHRTWIFYQCFPVFLIFFLMYSFSNIDNNPKQPLPEIPEAHPFSTLKSMSYYASNEDSDSQFLQDKGSDFQGVHIEFQQIEEDFFATLYYTKQGEASEHLCFLQGDSLLPVVEVEDRSYEIHFDQRGSGRLKRESDISATLSFSVNPLGELFFTLEENGEITVDHMSFKSPDIWRDGEFLYYVMADSPYEDPVDGANEVHPFQIINIFGQSIYQSWRNDNEVRTFSPGDIHLLSCKPHIFTGIAFTYYEKDDLEIVHTARSPVFINEIYLDDVHFVKFSHYVVE